MKIGPWRCGTVLAARMSIDNGQVGEDGAKSTTNRGHGAQEICFVPTAGAPGRCRDHFRLGRTTRRRRMDALARRLASWTAPGGDAGCIACTPPGLNSMWFAWRRNGVCRGTLSPFPSPRNPRNAGRGGRTVASRQRAARRCNDRPLPHPRCRRRQSAASCPRSACPASADRRVRP